MQVQRCGVRLSARTDVAIHPATATFRATQGQLNRYLQIWELKTTKALQVLPACLLTFAPAFGITLILSDLSGQKNRC